LRTRNSRATAWKDLGEIATGLVGQGLAIFDSLRGGLGQHESGDGSDRIGLNAPRNDHQP
jgi:flotillin